MLVSVPVCRYCRRRFIEENVQMSLIGICRHLKTELHTAISNMINVLPDGSDPAG